MKAHIGINVSLLLKNMNKIGHPCDVFGGLNETNLLELINFRFDSITLGRMDRNLLLVDGNGIGK